jgi:uncharacterized protein (DUF2062 family)
VFQRFKAYLRNFSTTLLTEGLSPASAAAAIFWGIFIGILPIYGLQTLAAIGVAYLLRLNKPLTLAATFINNPLLLPPTVVAAIELGGFLRTGSFRSLHMSAFSGALMKEQLVSWVLGSLVLGVALGAAAALFTAAVVYKLAPTRRS